MSDESPKLGQKIAGLFGFGKAKPAAPTPAPAPKRSMVFDWNPIDRDEPPSSDYGDNANFHVIPHQREHNSSTVAALFRIHPLPGGFVTTWRSFCVARNLDGSLRWRLLGWGKHLAVSPNGELLAVTRERAGMLAIVDAKTGQVVIETETPSRYLWQPAWTADGERIVVIGENSLIVIDRNGWILREIGNIPGGDPNPVLSSLLRMPDSRFAFANHNARVMVIYDERDDGFQTVAEKHVNNLFLAPSGTHVWIGSTGGIFSSTTPALEPAAWFRLPGKIGVRAADQADDFSYIQFQPIPRASTDDKLVLVNDRTGQLWLVGPKQGTAYHRWPREVVDQVEDSMWVADDAFIVATNDRRIRKLSFYSYAPEFDVDDG